MRHYLAIWTFEFPTERRDNIKYHKPSCCSSRRAQMFTMTHCYENETESNIMKSPSLNDGREEFQIAFKVVYVHTLFTADHSQVI
nr:unnamed protein product [Fasciola hepatica]